VGIAVTGAWKWAALSTLLCQWVLPPALLAAAATRFWPAVSLQLSRAYQVRPHHSFSIMFLRQYFISAPATHFWPAVSLQLSRAYQVRLPSLSFC